MLRVWGESHPVAVELGLWKQMIRSFLGRSDGLLLAETVILASHLLYLRFLQQPFVQVVGLDDHRI